MTTQELKAIIEDYFPLGEADGDWHIMMRRQGEIWEPARLSDDKLFYLYRYTPDREQYEYRGVMVPFGSEHDPAAIRAALAELSSISVLDSL